VTKTFRYAFNLRVLTESQLTQGLRSDRDSQLRWLHKLADYASSIGQISITESVIGLRRSVSEVADESDIPQAYLECLVANGQISQRALGLTMPIVQQAVPIEARRERGHDRFAPTNQRFEDECSALSHT